MANGKALRFGSLLGAQVTALIEAEVEGAQRTSEFIEAVGFQRDQQGNLSLAMVSFDMQRRDVDGEERTHTIRIPALTLMPLPLLTIESAQIDFAAQVEDVTTVEEEQRRQPQPGPRSQPRRGLTEPLRPQTRSTLVTRLARTSSSDTQTKADLRVSVKLTQSPFPIGIERLLETADLGVQDEQK